MLQNNNNGVHCTYLDESINKFKERFHWEIFRNCQINFTSIRNMSEISVYHYYYNIIVRAVIMCHDNEKNYLQIEVYGFRASMMSNFSLCCGTGRSYWMIRSLDNYYCMINYIYPHYTWGWGCWLQSEAVGCPLSLPSGVAPQLAPTLT